MANRSKLVMSSNKEWITSYATIIAQNSKISLLKTPTTPFGSTILMDWSLFVIILYYNFWVFSYLKRGHLSVSQYSAVVTYATAHLQYVIIEPKVPHSRAYFLLWDRQFCLKGRVLSLIFYSFQPKEKVHFPHNRHQNIVRYHAYRVEWTCQTRRHFERQWQNDSLTFGLLWALIWSVENVPNNPF